MAGSTGGVTLPYGRVKTQNEYADTEAANRAAWSTSQANAARAAGTAFYDEYTDPTGRTTYTNIPPARDTYARDLSRFSDFANAFGGDGGGGGGSASGSYWSSGGVGGGVGALSGGGGNVAAPPLDTEAIAAADRAGYAQAKDQVGGSMQGLMKSLSTQFGARGLRGSSLEGRAMASGLESGVGALGDVSRGQAASAGNRAADLAKTKYAGEITMRGQDIGANTAMAALQERASEAGAAQSAQAKQAKLASVLGLWNAFSGLNSNAGY